jgi:RHS repeat-associated protein
MGGSTYAYDGLGNRVRQTVGTVVTQYLLDLQPGLTQMLAQTAGAATDHFVHGPAGVLSQRDSAGGGWEWPLADGLGSVRSVAGSANAVLETRAYDPYGQPLSSTGTPQTPFGFTGELADANGLLYLRARHYAPRLGAFPSLDPYEGSAARPMSLNGYSWVEGNVSNAVDPSGMWGVADIALLNAWAGCGSGQISPLFAQVGGDSNFGQPCLPQVDIVTGTVSCNAQNPPINGLPGGRKGLTREELALLLALLAAAASRSIPLPNDPTRTRDLCDSFPNNQVMRCDRLLIRNPQYTLLDFVAALNQISGEYGTSIDVLVPYSRRDGRIDYRSRPNPIGDDAERGPCGTEAGAREPYIGRHWNVWRNRSEFSTRQPPWHGGLDTKPLAAITSCRCCDNRIGRIISLFAVVGRRTGNAGVISV